MRHRTVSCKFTTVLEESAVTIFKHRRWRQQIPSKHLISAGQLVRQCPLLSLPSEPQSINHSSHLFIFPLWLCVSPLANGLLIPEVSRSHSTTQYSLQDSSGRVISSSQRPLPDNTQQTSMSPVGFEPTISLGERPQTDVLDCQATGTGISLFAFLEHTCKINTVFSFLTAGQAMYKEKSTKTSGNSTARPLSVQ